MNETHTYAPPPLSSRDEFDADVKRFVLQIIESEHDAIFTCPDLTTRFIDSFVEDYGPLGGWNSAAYIGVAQTIRPLLRKRFEQDPDQTELDLPEVKLLQERYSVPGAGTDREPAYVPRHKLTREMMQAVVDRDRAISQHFARRADALESWWYRHNPTTQS